MSQEKNSGKQFQNERFREELHLFPEVFVMRKEVPEKKEIPEKLYFSIKEASKITNIAPHTLRFWEKKFPFLSPQKSKGGHRRYQKKDIEIILEIKKLIYERGFTIEGARKELQRERKKKESTVDLDFLKREIEEVIGLLD